MTRLNTSTTPTARWFAGFAMAAGLGSAVLASSAVASGDDTTTVNDIKIGNRSQFVQSADTPPPPVQQTTITGRPQTLVFKIGRLMISNTH
jgi:hypothetical protein